MRDFRISDLEKIMTDMRKIIMIIMGVALIALPTMAQEYGQQQYGATAPNAQIQSTSTFTGSGSAYSSNPTLNSDGTATYNGASYSPAKAPGGPRRVFDVGGETGKSTESPVGDALLPLMLMALAFVGGIALKRHKAEKAYPQTLREER
jgi:hypothetical protein